jgi:succinate dehydrogenase hydrophobic anchor subunit
MDKSDKEENFDPFNPISKDISDSKIEKKSNDDTYILYTTGAIIIILIIIWIVVVIMTKNDNVDILNEMSKSNNQVKLAVDK